MYLYVIRILFIKKFMFNACVGYTSSVGVQTSPELYTVDMPPLVRY